VVQCLSSKHKALCLNPSATTTTTTTHTQHYQLDDAGIATPLLMMEKPMFKEMKEMAWSCGSGRSGIGSSFWLT
jgi:hypothetical protein